MSLFIKKISVIVALVCITIACKSTVVNTVVQVIEEDPEEELEYEIVEIPANLEKLPESSFKEIWAYLISGYENSLKQNFPITDIVYFSAEVDRYGHLASVPKRKKIEKFKGRIHFSVTCNSSGLTHFILEEGSKARKDLLNELIAAAQPFDGLNMDFELVPARDADAYVSFLAELKAALGTKTFSVCVPARTKADNSYNYTKIAAVADKVFIMAYDEHWSSSKPGPVASMNWCKTVASYGLKTIGADKLVMGIPFYGRSWGDRSTSRGLIHSTTDKIIKENNIQNIKRENGIPTFNYQVTVNIVVYYEDTYSLSTRMEMYQKQGVRSVGFWRLGQEPIGVWNLVRTK
ncbi:MAG: glycoside hydrolase [Spirochaetaceae bacterium]|jgi:spore germination protein YaaH|nr:glycoside hydrolase [Spirochaetaceae bacterium]